MMQPKISWIRAYPKILPPSNSFLSSLHFNTGKPIYKQQNSSFSLPTQPGSPCLAPLLAIFTSLWFLVVTIQGARALIAITGNVPMSLPPFFQKQKVALIHMLLAVTTQPGGLLQVRSHPWCEWGI